MSIALALLAAHLVADFPLQPNWMAAGKDRSLSVRAGHCTVHGGVALLFLLPVVPVPTAVDAGVAVFVAHFVVDSLPRAEPGEHLEAYPLAVDQTLHVVSLYIVAVIAL